MKQYLIWPPVRRYLFSCSLSSQPHVLLCLVLVIVYISRPDKTRRNWVSHLLPDMIDKSLPSVISAKLLFRRAAAPSLPLLLLLIVLLTTGTGLPQPVSSFTAAVYRVSRTYRDQFYSRRNCLRPLRSRFSNPRIKKISDKCNCRKCFIYRKKKSLRIREFSTRKQRWNFCAENLRRNIFGLNSLAILLSGVDRAKGKLGWKLRLAAGWAPRNE